MSDGRRDRRELVVALLVETGVESQDQVGVQFGDAFEVEPVARREDDGLGIAELVLRPRPRRERLVAVPVRDGDRNHAERQQRVVLGQPDAHDPLRRRAHLGGPEGVLDGDRESGGGGLV